jgi:hypothetical protein
LQEEEEEEESAKWEMFSFVSWWLCSLRHVIYRPIGAGKGVSNKWQSDIRITQLQKLYSWFNFCLQILVFRHINYSWKLKERLTFNPLKHSVNYVNPLLCYSASLLFVYTVYLLHDFQNRQGLFPKEHLSAALCGGDMVFSVTGTELLNII